VGIPKRQSRARTRLSASLEVRGIVALQNMQHTSPK
jgi:hypothetical protein